MEELQNILERLEKLEEAYRDHHHTGLDGQQITYSDLLFDLIQAAITKPSGGLVIDIQARTAINSIIDALAAAKITK